MKVPLKITVWIGALVIASLVLPGVVTASETVCTNPVKDGAGMNRIQVQKGNPVHIQLKGLDADGRYELRTYIGTFTSARKGASLDVFWGDQRSIMELLADYHKASGDAAVRPEIIPCPLPDAIMIDGLHRNWRSGRELMEKGLDIDPEISGDLLWITTHRTGPVSTDANNQVGLDGEWRIAKDPGDQGKDSGWNSVSGYPLSVSKPIQVPGNVNEVFPGYSGIVWYAKTFVNRMPESDDLQAILRFKACSYRCDVWLNGLFVGSHEGGESPFEFVVAKQLRLEKNTVIIRVFFPKSSFMDGGSDGPCAYPVFWGMGGLTQGVDLVSKPKVRISDVFVRTDWKTGAISFDATIVNATDSTEKVKIVADYREFKSGTAVGSLSADVAASPGESTFTLSTILSPFHLWNLEDPFLYGVTVRTQWEKAADSYDVPHFGFRDFRINAQGYFELNGKRLFLKCTHGIDLDPLCLEGTPRDMTWLGVDFEILKATGFNAYRSAAYAALPEQLDLADELGFLIYSEHQGSWLMKDPAKFDLELPGLIKRDRNHPSLVIWGMLNEVGTSWPKRDVDAIYNSARNFLPRLRTIDATRLVLLSSGRFDRDFRTGSASNPGSADWNVYLGGEDPRNPSTWNYLSDGSPVTPYMAGGGDVHIYESFPISWEFVESMAKVTAGVRPIFVSEGGQGSAIDPFGFKRSHLKAGGASWMADVIEPRAKDLEAIWAKYSLYDIYPNIEDVVTASQRMAANQRALFLNILRSNPGINGYSMTDLIDTPDGEGIMDEFRHMKAGHYSMLTDGWAKLRWCLLVNPMNAYIGQSLRIRASLANEDVLDQGDYPARISVSGPSGVVWSKEVNLRVQGGNNPPLAYSVCDEDVTIDGLAEGQYTLTARLLNQPNAKAGAASFNVTDPKKNPDLKGFELTVLGVGPALRNLLVHSGIALRDYAENQTFQHEVILVGDEFKGGAPARQALQDRIAGGAFAIFLSREVLADDRGINTWLLREPRGSQSGGQGEVNLWCSEIIARDHPIFRGLPKGLLTPDIYGVLLRPKARFSDVAVPDDVAAVWMNLNSSPGFHTTDKVDSGVVIGTYNDQKGKFLINSFDLTRNVGQPAADRMILNMVNYGRTVAAQVQLKETVELEGKSFKKAQMLTQEAR